MPTSTPITMEEIASSKNLEISKVTLRSILSDLFAKERRGHVFSIIIFAPLIYILSQNGVLSPKISALAFLSLMSGYTITALMGLNENSRKYLEKSATVSEKDSSNSLFQSIIRIIFSNFKITIIPLSISLFVFLILVYINGRK